MAIAGPLGALSVSTGSTFAVAPCGVCTGDDCVSEPAEDVTDAGALVELDVDGAAPTP